MGDLDLQEPLSNLSDTSFVILEQGSLPPQINTDYAFIKNDLNFSSNNHCTNKNLEFRNGGLKDRFSSSCMNGNFLISEEGVQKKLDELVKENYTLKETLSQNNLAIKSQLDTFLLWQQEVLKTHKSHQEKFLETKDLILKLRAENMNLKKKLDALLIIASSVNDNEIYAHVEKKPEELEELNKRIKEHEETCLDLIEENNRLNMENQSLKENLKVTENEIYKLKSDLKNLKKENYLFITYLKKKEQDSNNNSFSNVLNKILLSSEAHLSTDLEDKKAEILKLKEELNKIKYSNAETSTLGEADQLNNWIHKLDGMNASLKLQNQRLNNLQSWVSLAEGNLKENKSEGVESKLICEINGLKSHLNQEESISKEKQESIQELIEQFTELLDDYKALQLNLSFINRKEKTIKFYTEEISCLSATLESKVVEVRLKQQECNNLKQVIEKLNQEETFLKMQVEQYKNDLMEERKAREAAVEQKENFAEKICLLESQLKKKQTASEQNNNGCTKLESSRSTENMTCKLCLRNHETDMCSLTFLDDFCT